MMFQPLHQQHAVANTLSALGWPTLQAQLLAACDTPYGQQNWLNEPFLSSPAAVEQSMATITVLKACCENASGHWVMAPQSPIDVGCAQANARPLFELVLRQGILDNTQLWQLRQLLQYYHRWLGFLQQRLHSLNPLAVQHSVFADLPGQRNFLESLLAVLAPLFDEPEGQLSPAQLFMRQSPSFADHASPMLGSLRQWYRQQQQDVEKRLLALMADPTNASALQSPVLTLREGRYVLPVRAAYKHQLPGILHASSNSGMTVYIEPQAMIASNNQLQSTHVEIEQEIERIARHYSSLLLPFSGPALSFLDWLGACDRLVSAARLASSIQAVPVSLLPEPGLNLRLARHPLLPVTSAVGNNLVLGQYGEHAFSAALIVSGPNMGGKTVLLKTMGLLVVMAHAGLLLPVAEGSAIYLYPTLRACLGDHQNLSTGMSTFAGHLTQILAMLEETPENGGLCLIDEICSGTDPEEGAALSMAIIEALLQHHQVVVTTHSNVLKLKSQQNQQCLNAAMGLNVETLSPTYHLQYDAMGQSYAVQVAQQLGFPEALLEKTQQYLDDGGHEQQRHLQALAYQLALKEVGVEKALKDAQGLRDSAQEAFHQWQYSRELFERQKDQFFGRYKQEVTHKLSGFLAEAETLLEKCRRETRLQQLTDTAKSLKNQADAVSQYLNAEAETANREELEKAAELANQNASNVLPHWIAVDNIVRSRRLGVNGRIAWVDESKKRLGLLFGNLTVTLPFHDVTPVQGAHYSAKMPQTPAITPSDADYRDARPGPEPRASILKQA